MFEYDPDKSAVNLAKHGINFEQAQDLWADDRRLIIATHPGQNGEVRALVVAMIAERLWSAVITARGEAIRIISVRRARDDEKELYYDQGD